MLDELYRLFDKKTISVLAEIPGKKTISIRETARNQKLSVASVFRVFQKLEQLGLLKKKKMGGSNVYLVDSRNKVYFLIDKLIPRKTPLDVFVEMITKEKTSQILLMDESEDRASIMVIGDVKLAKANEIAEAVKKESGFSIKVLALTQAQLENMEALNMKPVPKRILFQR